ncbi:MAG: ABC transporter permease [Bacteroidales bacterium]|nr:ABC transporter permease [Bacteroidales bacterium]
MKALPYLLVKEYKQMFRNILLPVIFVILPIAMMNVVPRIATQEIKNLNVAVIDCDHSTLSSRLIQKLQASDFFNLYASCPNYEQAYDLLLEGKVDFIVTIENEFEKNIYRTGGADVMTTVNAVNGMKGGLGGSYLMQIIMNFSQEIARDSGITVKRPVQVEPRYLFNASLDYKPYMIPALMAMTLILLVGFLPALNVVGEKERGTIEQINVTPVKRMEFILSKMIPYWSVGIFIVAFCMVLAWKIHGVVPQGSIALVFLFNLAYIFTISSLGLTISNYSDNMRQAAIVMFFFIVIFILTSGLISPIASMPHWAQQVTRLNPLRYIITAMREIYLKGSTFSQLLNQFVPLCIYGAAASIFAVISFRKNY